MIHSISIIILGDLHFGGSEFSFSVDVCYHNWYVISHTFVYFLHKSLISLYGYVTCISNGKRTSKFQNLGLKPKKKSTKFGRSRGISGSVVTNMDIGCT